MSALRHFQHRRDNLILVADPDGLLLEEQMLVILGGRGFDVLTYDDPVAFRYVSTSSATAITGPMIPVQRQLWWYALTDPMYGSCHMTCCRSAALSPSH